MRQIFIVASFVLISFGAAIAQDKVAQLVNYELEYFNAQDAKKRSTVALKKLDLLLSFDSLYLKKCIQEIARVSPSLLSKKEQATFYWNATIISMLDRNDAEIVYARRYAETTEDSTLAAQILYLLAVAQSEQNNPLQRYITNVQLNNILACQRSKYAVRQRKKGYEVASAFVPGLGMMLKGHYIKGATSLGLHSLSSFLVYSMLRNNLYGNALSVSTLVLSKLYMGNLTFTRNLSNKNQYRNTEKKISQCENALADLLIQYPIMFR